MCTPARGRLGWRPPPVGWTTSKHTRQAASSGAGSVAVGVRPATLPIIPAPPPLDPTLPRRYAEPAHGRRPPPATPRATLVGVPLATAAASPRGTCPRRRWAVAPARRDDRRRSVAAPRRPPSFSPPEPSTTMVVLPPPPPVRPPEAGRGAGSGHPTAQQLQGGALQRQRPPARQPRPVPPCARTPVVAHSWIHGSRPTP